MSCSVENDVSAIKVWSEANLTARERRMLLRRLGMYINEMLQDDFVASQIDAALWRKADRLGHGDVDAISNHPSLNVFEKHATRALRKALKRLSVSLL